MYKICVVDDEEQTVRLLEEFFIGNGFEVIPAVGGAEALDLIKTRKEMDLMILDLKMPEIDGVEVLNEMRKADIQIPVLVLSGSSYMRKDDLKKVGCHEEDILVKPVSLFYILSKVKDKLNMKKDQGDSTGLAG